MDQGIILAIRMESCFTKKTIVKLLFSVDIKTLSLHDWAITHDPMRGPLSAGIRNEFQKVDDCLLACEYPSEIEIAAAATKTQFNEKFKKYLTRRKSYPPIWNLMISKAL
ncbi:hypothetical protein Trydic_g15623 [Trypoxylus dichotomus]